MNWIKVSERFPEIGQQVLVYSGENPEYDPIYIEYRMCDDYWSQQGLFTKITHWMPLPVKPEIDE